MTKKKYWGFIAEYINPQILYKACKEVRKSGYTHWDACTPFPVHGLEKAMGLKSSILPWFVLVAGTTGFITSLAFIVWVSVIEYPLNISGKPLLSIPAFIPVMFEVTILFSGLTSVFGMFLLNKMPTYYHPLFNNKRFAKVTDDKFFILIQNTDPLYNEENIKSILTKTGASYIELVEK